MVRDLTSTALASKANRWKLLIVVVLRTRPFGKLRKGATVKKGSNSIWWDNIISGVSVQDEWHENFRMSRETFNYLCIVKYLDFYINRQWREVTITMVWTLAKPYRNSDCLGTVQRVFKSFYSGDRFQKFGFGVRFRPICVDGRRVPVSETKCLRIQKNPDVTDVKTWRHYFATALGERVV